MENFYSLSDEYHFYFNKYIKHIEQILFYSRENVIDKEKNEEFKCPICLDILKEPISCSDKKNSHSFCKECIDNCLKDKNKCPMCKLTFKYKINNDIYASLNNLLFKCAFENEGCKDIIPYTDYLNHVNNCEYNNTKYECQVKKYNYKKKIFIKCGYTGNKIKIEKHFHICGFTKYNCLFCNEYVLQMNLEEHFTENCIFGIINYQNGDKYIGYKFNGKKEGFGKLFYEEGNKYDGEFYNDLRHGYGKLYYYNGRPKYIGEFKYNNMEGYGILVNYNGDKYEGEFINGKKNGYGKIYYSNGEKYEGIFKNDKKQDYGILYYSNGNKYIGEFKYDYKNGYGIYYYLDGDKYQGQWSYDSRNGYGIYYYSNGDKYEGYWKNDLRNGYGIYYFSNGDKYKGQWKNDKQEGYSTYYYSKGGWFEGEYKNNLREGNGIEYYINGDRYEGKIKNNLGEGYGVYYFSNGDRYESEWKNGDCIGYIFFYSCLGFKYEGYLNPEFSTKTAYAIYKILLFLNKQYSLFLKNKITLILIFILILGIIIK